MRPPFQTLATRLCLILWLGLCTLAHAAGPRILTDILITPGLVAPPDTANTHWQAVHLDDSWRRQTPCRTGTWTYLAPLENAYPNEEDLGILIHRAGNRLRLWANQTLVAQFGDLDNPQADYSNAPLYARIPAHLLRPDRNHILIQVAGDCRRYSGLSQFEVGPHTELEPRWRSTTNLFVWQSMAIISTCGILAFLSLGLSLWRQDRQSLIFGILSGFWSLRATLWAMNELPFSYETWFFLIDLSFGIWIALTSLLAMQVSQVDIPFLRRIQWGSLLMLCLTSLASALGAPIALKGIGLDLTILAAALGLLSICYVAIRTPDLNKVAIGVAGFLMLAVGLVDHWNIWLSQADDAYHRYYLTPPLVMFYILSMGAVLARRFEHALDDEARHRRMLEAEVAQQRAELEQTHTEAQAHLRQETIAQERQRIVRDMHDGLGKHLSDLLSRVKKEAPATAHIEADIQDALDQLRYTMDTLSCEGEDLTSVLAQFRFRNEARFARIGIQLNWQVRPLHERAWSRPAMLTFQRMLHEIFTHILRHTATTQVTVEAWHDPVGDHLSIRDNSPSLPLPVGQAGQPGNDDRLLRLQEHACALQASLSLSHPPEGGLQIQLDWPTTTA